MCSAQANQRYVAWNKKEEERSKYHLIIFNSVNLNNPSRKHIFSVDDQYTEMTNKLQHRQGPAERDDISQVRWKIASCLFIRIDNAAHSITCGWLWLLLKRNTESVFWPFIRLARPYQWIDINMRLTCLTEIKEREKKTTRSLLVTQ